MLKLAANPGTVEEGLHASKVAMHWIEKYQLNQASLSSDLLHCAEYEIEVRLDTEAWRGADKAFQSSCNTWICALATKVARIYTDFVKGFTKKVRLFDHTWFSVVFVGVEDAAWSATDIFCSLFRMICHYARVMIRTGKYHAVKSIESYAMGLVNGLASWTERKRIGAPAEGRIKKLDTRAHLDGHVDGHLMKTVEHA